jgi:hypothetical protein
VFVILTIAFYLRCSSASFAAECQLSGEKDSKHPKTLRSELELQLPRQILLSPFPRRTPPPHSAARPIDGQIASMRLLEAPSTLLSFVAILLASTQPANSTPFSRLADLIHQQLEERGEDVLLQNTTLQARSNCLASQTACGYYGQVCCNTGSETCGTNAKNEAICIPGAAAAVVTGSGSWQTYTSTWVETNTITRTSIWSTWVPGTATVAVAAGPSCSPNWANNESGCGPKCCSSGEYCYDMAQGICRAAGNGGFTTTGVGYSAPLRPTNSAGVIITQTISPTTTIPYQTPVPTGAQNGGVVEGHKGGLSGGAIAGIVIGVLAAIILLILICLCCCFKAGFDGLLALLGLGKKKRSRRVVEEEYIESHRRHGSGSDRRWYGSAAGSRPSRPSHPSKTGGFGGLLGATAGLGGLALALGLKRKHDRKHEKSDVSSSYGSSYYDYTSSKIHPHT